MAIKVRAKALGLYKGVRKREGVEFLVQSESEIARWMERLDGKPHPKDVKPSAPPVSQPAPRSLSEINAQQKAAEDAAAKGKTKDGAPI